MSVGLEHPLVADYLRRLDEAACALPAGRRGELAEEIRGHVAEALGAVGDDEAGVRHVLDRLGSPEDIVSAELDGPAGPAARPGATPGFGPAAAGAGAAATLGGYPAPGPSAAAPAYGSLAPQRVWGPLEIIAVVSLTIGSFVVPVVGPICGLICAWASQQWSRREKIVATIWTSLGALVVVGLAFGLVAFRSGSSSGPVVIESGPAVEQPVPSELAPSDVVPPDLGPLSTPEVSP